MTPIEFAIILNLQTALQAIDKADGYHHTLNSASVKLDPNGAIEQLRQSSGVRPYVLVEFSEDAFDLGEKPDGLRLELPLSVHWIHESDSADDASMLRKFFEGCADVEKAIMVDRDRGGRASDTRMTTRRFNFEGSEVWAEIGVVIPLRRQYGEPNEA